MLDFSSFFVTTAFLGGASLLLSIADDAAAAARAALFACCAAPGALFVGFAPFLPGTAIGTQTSLAFSRIPFIVAFEDV